LNIKNQHGNDIIERRIVVLKKILGDEDIMARSNNNQLVNPNARDAMNRFKMETASQVGVNLKQGYNGDITAKQAGSIGGQMVKKMIESYESGL
jgi:hypothetical protein